MKKIFQMDLTTYEISTSSYINVNFTHDKKWQWLASW